MAAKTLKASIVIGGAVAQSMRTAIAEARGGFRTIGTAITDAERRQKLLSNSIQTFGRQGRNVSRMREEYAQLTRQVDRLRVVQASVADIEARQAANAAARSKYGAELRTAAFGFAATAGAVLAPVKMAADFESAMLGVAKQLDGARDDAGKLTPKFYEMQASVRGLGRELPIATNEIADMVAAGLRMGVAGDEIIGFTRTAAKMADAFELPAGKLADDMGKIAGLFHIPVTEIEGLADAINYLDDNALSAGGDIIDVMRRIGGMAKAVNMPAQEAAALGSTFLTMGSSAEVAGTATNALMRILGAASTQSKRVQNGIRGIGLSVEELQAGMQTDATGTILKVLDRLNSLSGEKRLVAASQIFGAEYGDDVAKLATGAEEYRRQLALVASEGAKGSMSREFAARMQTANAQWQVAKNRMGELGGVIGSALLPQVNQLLAAVGPMVTRVAGWIEKNPQLVRGVAATALAVAGLNVAVRGAMYGFTVLRGPVLAVVNVWRKFQAGQALAAMGRFGPVAARSAMWIGRIGAAIAGIGTGPIALAAAALTAVALVVRKYWQPIKAFLGGVFDGLRDAVGPVMAEVQAAFAPIMPQLAEVGALLGKVWNWFVELLAPVNMADEELKGIADTGRQVGHVLGAMLMSTARMLGTVIGLIAKMHDKFQAAAKMVGSGIGAVAGFLGLGNAVPQAVPAGAVPKPAPASVSAAGRAGARAGAPVVQDSSQHTYNITQLPGESAEELARRIEAERRRAAAAQRRGSLTDGVN